MVRFLSSLFHVMWCPVLAMGLILLSTPIVLYLVDHHQEMWSLLFGVPFLWIYCLWLVIFLVIVFLLRIKSGGRVQYEISLVGYKPSLTFWYVSLALSAGACIGFGIIFLGEYDLYPENDFMLELLFELMAFSFYGFITMVLLGPLVEEIIFRGVVLKRLLPKIGAVPALLISSALFSAWHMNWFQMPYTFVMGIVFGLVFIWSRSLWSSVIVHMVNNALSLLPDEFEDVFLELPLAWQVVLLAILLGASLWILSLLKARAVPQLHKEGGKVFPVADGSVPVLASPLNDGDDLAR